MAEYLTGCGVRHTVPCSVANVDVTGESQSVNLFGKILEPQKGSRLTGGLDNRSSCASKLNQRGDQYHSGVIHWHDEGSQSFCSPLFHWGTGQSPH